MAEKKVILDLEEFERLRAIESEIYDAFKNKELVRLSYTRWGDRVCFKLVNESEVIQGLMAEIEKGKDIVNSAWAETERIKSSHIKKKWWHF